MYPQGVSPASSASNPVGIIFVYFVLIWPAAIFFLNGVVPKDIVEGAGMAAALGLAGIGIAIYGFLKKERISLVPEGYGIFVMVPLFLSSLVSSWRTLHLDLTIYGYGFELGTVGSTLSLFLVCVIAGSISRTAASWLLRAFLSFVALAGAFFVCGYFTGFGSGLGIYWSDFSMLLASALPAAFIWSYVRIKGDKSPWISVGVLFLITISFLTFFFAKAAVLVAMVFLAVVFLEFIFSRSMDVKKSYAMTAIGVVLLTLSFFGWEGATSKMSSSVQPSFLSGVLVVVPAYLESPQQVLLGMGANSYGEAWEKYRPVEFNASPVWY